VLKNPPSMCTHYNRSRYAIAGEGVVVAHIDHHTGGAPANSPNGASEPDLFRFGRLFEQHIDCLKKLAGSMSTGDGGGDSQLHSGYTYLGQFIAHEITFDKTKDLPLPQPISANARSPQFDLDSLYGKGPESSGDLYESDSALLKIGSTSPFGPLPSRPNDLPRDPNTGKALIGDERNDENLAVAQLHVALIKFHNLVVENLRPTCPAAQLFETAREEVVRHFQWIVVHDYLRKILDTTVLDKVVEHGPNLLNVDNQAALFIPIEFSVAAFRFGHSMVRKTYEWNYFHSKEIASKHPAAALSQLFMQTAFSGTIGKTSDGAPILRLPSDWIIDWRRFFDFSGILEDGAPKYKPPKTGPNLARKIDTFIDMDLASMQHFPQAEIPEGSRSIAARNLLRGFALGLPSAEEVAAWIDEASPLTRQEIVSGHEDCFNTPSLTGRTPLWYYILKEAEVKRGGNGLGSLGSRIVAETLIALIKNSRYSILDGSGWHPNIKYGRPGSATEPVIFEMVDLLHRADVVNPLG